MSLRRSRPSLIAALTATVLGVLPVGLVHAQPTGTTSTIAIGAGLLDPDVELGPDGAPVIAYADGLSADAAVRVARCLDTSCTRVVSVFVAEGFSPTLRMDGDVPVVAHLSGTTAPYPVLVTRCTDAACSDALTIPLGITVDGIDPPAFQLDADGNPVVLYGDRSSEGDFRVRLLDCDDVSCNLLLRDVTTIATPSGVARGLGLELAADARATATWRGGSTTQQLTLCFGADASCSSLVRGQRAVDGVTSLALTPADLPVLAGVDGDDVRLLVCSDAIACAAPTTRAVVQGAQQPAVDDLVVGTSGSPVIVHEAFVESERTLDVTACTDPTCTTSSTTTLISSPVPGGSYQASAVMNGQLPVIAYADGAALLVAICGSADCSDLAIDDGDASGDVSAICPTPPANPFTDVADDGVFRPAIACLADQGIVNGLTATTFGPGQNVTRGQSAALVARTIRAVPFPLPSGPAVFDDVTGGFADEIHALAAVGVVGGTGGANFSPGEPLTRGEAAAILVAAYVYVTQPALPQDPPDAFDDDDGGIFETTNNLAAAVGLVDGFDDGTFRPSQRVTRGQFTQLLANLLILSRG